MSSSEEATRTVVVTNRHGLCAHPCSAIVNTVGRYDAKVTIHKQDQAVEATSVLALMALAATYGTELLLTATGREAEQVLEKLSHQFADGFGFSDPE